MRLASKPVILKTLLNTSWAGSFSISRLTGLLTLLAVGAAPSVAAGAAAASPVAPEPASAETTLKPATRPIKVKTSIAGAFLRVILGTRSAVPSSTISARSLAVVVAMSPTGGVLNWRNGGTTPGTRPGNWGVTGLATGGGTVSGVLVWATRVLPSGEVTEICGLNNGCPTEAFWAVFWAITTGLGAAALLLALITPASGRLAAEIVLDWVADGCISRLKVRRSPLSWRLNKSLNISGSLAVTRIRTRLAAYWVASIAVTPGTGFALA